MCGIAGWIDPQAGAGEDAQARLARMCRTIIHRGPDDEGRFVAEGVALGMRRLSILDIEGGRQPMVSDDGAMRIVFNGEIFNHDDLRRRLIEQGCRFATHSDTEVALRLFEREGVGAFEQMNGMFAMAIWSSRDRALHLVRDRMGVKPLYYYWNGTRLIFASEIKAILEALPARPELNEQAIWDYFTFRYVPQPGTIWRNIHKLPPAHHLTFWLGREEPRIERWWDMPRPSDQRRDDEDLIQEFDALLTDATRLRMLADVPVGVLLSGGLDSSLIAARAARSANRLKTYSIAFEGAEEIDERPYARQVARKLGADHHEMVIDHRAVADFLPEFVHYADEPLGDAVCVPLYYVSRLARRDVKVLLAGEGADETLGGYNFDQWARRWDEAARPSPLPALAGGETLVEIKVDLGLLDLRLAPKPPTMTAYLDCAQKRALFKKKSYADSHEGARRALARLGDASPLAQSLYLYCQDWLVEDLLMKADKMSMATSVELRTPFLDYRLVEAAARLPDHLRVGRNEAGDYETKRILRILSRRSRELPDDIVQRPKMGFPVPIYEWLREPGRLLPLVRDYLTGPNVKLRDWLDPKALADVVELGTAFPGKRRNQHIVYNALIMEMWLRRWK